MFRLQSYLAGHRPKNGAFHTIAIDGRGGSGKSSLARYLQELDPSLVVVHGDDYNRANGSAWFGVPDEELKRRDLFDPVQRGARLITPRRYDWTAKTFTAPREVVVRSAFCFEECFAFEYPVDWDVLLWVQVSRQESFDRAVRRESAENGWDTPAERYRDEWRQWQTREDTYIARVDPVRLATAVLDGLRPWPTRSTRAPLP